MSHVKISHSKEPIRLFKSDILEFFTHINPLVVLAIWLPVVVIAMIAAVNARPAGTSLLYAPVGFVIGLFVWTFLEYIVHRFIFHFRPRTPWQERVSFMFHGVHHAQPMCKTRLVMPPVVSITGGLILYGVLYALIGILLNAPYWMYALLSGIAAGYLTYDMLHYSTHHFKLKWNMWQFLRQHHMRHHAQTPDMRFGVSSPLWDYVFGTMPAQAAQEHK